MIEALQPFAELVNAYANTINVITIVIVLIVFIILMFVGPSVDESPSIPLIRQSGARTRIRMEQLKREILEKAKEGRYGEENDEED